MTTPIGTPSFFDKTKRFAITATTLASILSSGAPEVLPSEYIALDAPYSHHYRWEADIGYNEKGATMAEIDQFQVLQEFVIKVVTQSKELDPQYDRLISENFWDLV